MIAGKFGLHKLITATGSLGEFDIDGDKTARFVVANAGASFTITISGRIAGQSGFTLIDTVVSNGQKDVDIAKWDFLKIEITTYDSLSNYVDVSGSGFRDSTTGGGGGPTSNVAVTNFPSNQNVTVTSLPVTNKFAPPFAADYVSTTYNSTTDVYQYRQGGAGGTLLKTITVTYTDNTKTFVSNVEVS